MHRIGLPGSRLDTPPARSRRRLPFGRDRRAVDVCHGPRLPVSNLWLRGQPGRYCGGRSTSASGRSSAATRSAYPGSQVASSAARMRSSSGRSRRGAAVRCRAERRRAERRGVERRRGDCCREGNRRERAGPGSRVARCRRCVSEVISKATTTTASTPRIIHSPPVPVQSAYARLNHVTPGTSGKWFVTESAELFLCRVDVHAGL